MLHGFREVKCWWEIGEVGRWERWKGNEVAEWEKRVNVNLMLIKGTKGIGWRFSKVPAGMERHSLDLL